MSTPASKQEICLELLDAGMIMIVLDSRFPGVVVPDHLRRDPQLRLNLSHRFGLPLDLDEEAITATLTFDGSPFACRIPWSAVYAVFSRVTGEPHVFLDDLPQELTEAALSTTSPTAAPRKPPVTLSVAADNPTPEPSSAEAKRAKRVHLRVVK